MTVKEYQHVLLNHIKTKFPSHEIRNEWTSFTGFRYQYSPRVDIAIGPFSTQPGRSQISNYNHLVQETAMNRFLRRAFSFHVNNLDPILYTEINHPEFDYLINKNQNSRCLIALEIENTCSKKHMMGSVVNAASLGRIGLGIAYCPSALRTFLRILNYLSFLKRVEKNSYDVTNFLVLSVDQVNSLLNTRHN